ncbi:MAG: tetratricopeptide (TPR) repeat protein [Myxococcota bacterium]|jgi:tetratricopeptide (TPR) repeat protein
MSRYAAAMLALVMLLSTPATGVAKQNSKADKAARYARYLMVVERDYATAAAEWERVLKLNRKYPGAHRAIGQTRARLGDWPGAMRALQKAVKIAPRDMEAWQALGLAQVRQGKTAGALKSFEKALEIKPNFAAASFAAANLLYERFRTSKDEADKARAIKLYKRFLSSGGTGKGAEAGRVQALLARLEGGEAAGQMLEARALYNKAFVARGRMNVLFEQAYRKFGAVLETTPKNQEALFYQGLIHLSVKSKKLYDVDKAIEKLAACGDYAPALAELGRHERKQDDLDAALTYLGTAVKVDPKHQRSWYELGLVHKLGDDRDKAVAAFRKAFDLDIRSDVAARAVVNLSHLSPTDTRVMRHYRANRQFKGDIFDTEKFKGSIQKLELRLGGVDTTASEQVWLDEMMRRLLDASELKVGTMFTVKVVKTKMVNAFAVPDGTLYFTRGFLDFVAKNFPNVKMDVDNAVVAAVMGHEITHVTKEHVIRSFVFKDAIKAQRRLHPQVLVSVTRNHEIEADREGMKLMFLAGYDPRWAVKLHSEYARVLGEVPGGLDHPTFDERIHYLEEYWSNEMAFAYASFAQGTARLNEAATVEAADLNKAAALYREAVDDLKRYVQAFGRSREAMNNLALAHAKLGLFELARLQPSSAITRWYTEFSVEPELALKFVPLTRRRKTRSADSGAKIVMPADLRRAKVLLAKTLKKHPKYARAGLNLGVVLLAMGEHDAAEKALTRVQENCKTACPVAPEQVANLLGIVHAERGRVDRAVAAFEAAVKRREGAKLPARIFNLAVALERADRKEEAAEMYQQFLNEYGGNDTSSWAVKARTGLARVK